MGVRMKVWGVGVDCIVGGGCGMRVYRSIQWEGNCVEMLG